ncbi:MAG: ParB/RepB/Spo0J family partition protein, partial [Streptococcus sp.]|nr:ParB/RepB/Spo0J family partition protein [Streptococcus sp.]
MSEYQYQNNSIFWVETEKIKPNPFQPRREFEAKALEDLADSIRQYGVLQPLVVTRKEVFRPDDGGMDVFYELIAGERRLRASKIAGLSQIPVIIRKETDDKVKLELAIIENLQREDLNPIDRALAFEQLHKEFGLTHVEIGKRMGKSRVYVSNTLRLLSLPSEIKQGLLESRITEGHTRPLLMLADRPEEQTTLYKEIMVKKMSVRDAEKVARKIAQDRVRKKEFVVDPKIQKYEKQLAENLGTRVHIEPKENGGQITIDYFTIDDLELILDSMKKVERTESMMDSYLTGQHTVSFEQVHETPEKEIEETTPVSFSHDQVKEEQKNTTQSALESKDPLELSKGTNEAVIDDNMAYLRNRDINQYHESSPPDESVSYDPMP